MAFTAYAPHPGLALVMALPEGAHHDALIEALSTFATPSSPDITTRWRPRGDTTPFHEIVGGVHETPSGWICRLEWVLTPDQAHSDRVHIGDGAVLEIIRGLRARLGASIAIVARGGTLGELHRRDVEALPRHRFEGAVIAGPEAWPALAALREIEGITWPSQNRLVAWPDGEGGMIASRGWLEAGSRASDDSPSAADLPWSLRAEARALPDDDTLSPILVFALGNVDEDDIARFFAHATLNIDPHPRVVLRGQDDAHAMPSAALRGISLKGEEPTPEQPPHLHALLDDEDAAWRWLWRRLGVLHLRSPDGACVLAQRDDGLTLALLPNTEEQVDAGAAWMWPIIDAMLETLPCRIFAAGHPWADDFEVELADEYALLARRRDDALLIHLEPGWFGRK